MSLEMTGSDILVRSLADEGVEHVFGYPGGSVLYIYDAIYKQDKFRHILVRHEQAAVHAADAYARSSGKVGVALVTSGPGVTNAITGLATAYMDSIPLVLISGQVSTHAIGSDAFQECDAVGITRPCVKHNFLVKDVKDLAVTIKKAFYIASTGRPGPVLVDIPKDVSMQAGLYDYPKEIEMRSYKPIDKGHTGQIRKAVQMMLQAERPLVYAGGGVILSDSAPELNQLVDRLDVPCVTTLQGLGGYRASSEKYLGMPGMHGTYEANMAMQNCDVLIAIGARFDDRVIGNPDHFSRVPRKIIHIDIDPSSISKRVKVDIPIVGNVKDVLQEMLAQLDATPTASTNPQAMASWWKQINEWRKKDCLKYEQTDQVIKPQYVIEKLWEVTKGDAFVASDVGQHQMWSAQLIDFEKPHSWISSGGLGTMGFGLPAAIGASVGSQRDFKGRKPVWLIAGDGSFQMTSEELTTAFLDHAPVKIAIINNSVYGMVRQWQTLFFEQHYSQTNLADGDSKESGEFFDVPDFVKLAEAYGCVGLRAFTEDEAIDAINKANEINDRPVLIDFRVWKDAMVWPMVAAGASNNEVAYRPGTQPLLHKGVDDGDQA